MTIETNLAEIRASAATVSALHAQDNLSRADLIAAIGLIEAACDDIARLAQPAAPMTFGTVVLPIMTLADVAAQTRADDAARRARPQLAPRLSVVSNEGTAA